MKRALLIGINYNGSAYQLSGCINDMETVKFYLLQRGYPPENIKLLTDETAVKPTRKNVLDAIAWLVNNLQPGDTTCFYYSGHGARVLDISGDEQSGLDNVLVPIDADTSGVITDDEFRKKLVNCIPVGANLWAFFDCCHSGTMLDLRYNFVPDVKLLKQGGALPSTYAPSDWADTYRLKIQADTSSFGSVVMFSGCLDPQTSADAPIKGKAQGAFTYCLMECLNKKKPLGARLRDVLKEVNGLLTINGFAQRSQLSIGYIEDFNKPLNI